MASAYVRWTRRGTWYDCNPISARMGEQLLRHVGFVPENVTADALFHFIQIEVTSPILKKVMTTISTFGGARLPFIPTVVFVARC